MTVKTSEIFGLEIQTLGCFPELAT